jgi:hypothetical protein
VKTSKYSEASYACKTTTLEFETANCLEKTTLYRPRKFTPLGRFQGDAKSATQKIPTDA